MSIDNFKANLTGGGARANQFRVILNRAPVAPAIEIVKASFLIKAAALPGQTITEIAVPFRGRNLYLAGDREFDTWDTTIINDTDFSIRNSLEGWMNAMNNLTDGTGESNVTNYTADLRVEQLGRDGQILKFYILKGCMPTVMAPIDLSMETASAIEEFAVTWRYTSFTASGI